MAETWSMPGNAGATWIGRVELADAQVGAADADISWTGNPSGVVLHTSDFRELGVVGEATTQDATVTVHGRNADDDGWVEVATGVNCVAGTPTLVFNNTIRFNQIKIIQRYTTSDGGTLDVSFCLKR